MNSLTDFKPEIDGFSFRNSWTVTEADRVKTHEMLSQEKQSAALLLTPVIAGLGGTALLALAGTPVAPVFEALGPCLITISPALAPLLIDKIIDEASCSATGRCAGMAYASLDYFEKNWLIPCGSNVQPDENPNNPFELWLREYIYKRQMDSHRNNGSKFLLYFVMNSLFGDWGRDFLRNETRREVGVLRNILASGKPWPIGLISASGGLESSHVVVATDFKEIHPDHVYQIEIYENTDPDRRVMLTIDFSSNTVVSENHSNGMKHWVGMFCCNYTPEVPRPALVVTDRIKIQPPTYSLAGNPFKVRFPIKYTGHGLSRKIKKAVGESAGIRWGSSDGEKIQLQFDLPPNEQDFNVILYRAGSYNFHPMVAVYPNDENSVTVPSYKIVPNEKENLWVPYNFVVNPRVSFLINNYDSLGETITYMVEGDRVIFRCANIPFNRNVGIQSYQWEVSGGVSMSGTGSSIEFIVPSPENPVNVKVNLLLTDGTGTYGELQLVIRSREYRAAMLQVQSMLARIAKLIPDIIVDPKDPYVKELSGLVRPRELRFDFNATKTLLNLKNITRSVEKLKL